MEVLGYMKSQQSDKKSTKQVRIDSGLHKLLKIKAAESSESIKSLVEGALADMLGVDSADRRNRQAIKITKKVLC